MNTSRLKWKEHTFVVDAMLSYGLEPTVQITRDLQTFSNIEAGFLFGFFQCYYRYEWKSNWLKVGHMDINTDFLVPDYGVSFAHSSFGIDPVASINMPAPTYPVSAMSVSTHFELHHKLGVGLAIFDGQFEEPRGRFLGPETTLDKDEGFIYLMETNLTLIEDRWVSKLGSYHHSGLFYNYSLKALTRGQWAIYQINDIKLLQKKRKELGLFTQFNSSSPNVSQLSYYFGTGLSAKNFINAEKDNELGFAFGYAKVNTQFEQVVQALNSEREYVLELNFQHDITEWMELQYYIQYINMGELNHFSNDPLIAAIRIQLETEQLIQRK